MGLGFRTRIFLGAAGAAVLGVVTPVPEADVEARLAREIRFDPDVWIVEIEDRAGRHFLDHVMA